MEETKRPVDETLDNLTHVEATIREWREMFKGEGWVRLKQYLEARYIDLNDKTVDSVKALADRNGRMSEIRMIFTFLKEDYNERQRLLQDLRTFDEDEDTLPTKPTFFS